MRSPRYQLRFITGVSLTAATYGSGTYGTGTYGEQASDPLSSLHYRVIPWPGGFLADPSWIYRQADTLPQFRAQIRSDEGPLDFTGLGSAVLVLTQTEPGAPATPWSYELTVTRISGLDWLVRDWKVGDLVVPGTYRAGLVLQYNSGRRLSIPSDDSHNFVITPNELSEAPGVPAYRWDEARWDYAYWGKS